MKRSRMAVMVTIAVVFCGAVATAQAPQKQPPMQKQPQAQRQGQGQQPPAQDAQVLKQIESELGFVPQWIRQIPSTLLPSFWSTLQFQLGTDTALDRKTKELIGLAVAAQIPCEYCVMFHTDVARSLGASDQEIREAVGMAAVTREASTLLNGLSIDKNQFRKDLDRTVRGGRQQARR